MSITKKSILLILIILVLDQTSKILVKTNMMIGQEYNMLGNWFIIHFTENSGMAFGLEFGGNAGKFILSIFRIIAVIGIIWYIRHLIIIKAPAGLILSVALIFAGAIGNIIDSAFYGVIFNESHYQVAKFFPEGGGYSTFLHGKVVDMLYFPLIKGYFPSWFPFWRSQQFIFFRPVFNIADSAITIGVFIILFFHRKYFKENT